MPGKRSPGQTLVAFPLEEEMLRQVDSARKGTSRSKWVREAIAEKLRGMGMRVQEEWVSGPDRSRPMQSGVQIGDNNTLNQSQTFSSASDAPPRKRVSYTKAGKKPKAK